jgi:hypothetical protein
VTTPLTLDKDPDAKLPFAVDWSAWLTAEGDTAASADWTVPAGLTKESSPAETLTSGVATVWISGGTLGQSYEVVCRLTTTAGRIDDRTIRILIKNR